MTSNWEEIKVLHKRHETMHWHIVKCTHAYYDGVKCPDVRLVIDQKDEQQLAEAGVTIRKGGDKLELIWKKETLMVPEVFSSVRIFLVAANAVIYRYSTFTNDIATAAEGGLTPTIFTPRPSPPPPEEEPTGGLPPTPPKPGSFLGMITLDLCENEAQKDAIIKVVPLAARSFRWIYKVPASSLGSSAKDVDLTGEWKISTDRNDILGETLSCVAADDGYTITSDYQLEVRQVKKKFFQVTIGNEFRANLPFPDIKDQRSWKIKNDTISTTIRHLRYEKTK